MKRLLCLLLYCIAYLLTSCEPAIAGQAAQAYCKVSSLPIDRANELAAVRLSATSFFGITSEYSTASVELVNLSSVSIDGVALIVEYFDASGIVVLRVPFYATTEQKLPDPPFLSLSPQWLEKFVASGDRIVLVGNTPVVSSICPTKGRVTFERVWLSDGTQESSGSRIDWDAFPDVLPAYFDSTRCHFSWPFDVLIQLRIQRSGDADIVKTEGGSKGQVECLRKELRLWTFSPALRSGFPVESEVEILLRVHSIFPSDDVAWQLVRKRASSSLTVVHLLQSEENEDHWHIFYAGDCCTRVIRSRRLYRQESRAAND